MTYPYEAGEAERFIPPSLAEMPSPPTFWLRWGTMREKKQQRRLMDIEGLRAHDSEAQREELLKGMEALFSPEDFALWEPRARQWWDALDAFAEEHKDTPAKNVPEFVFEGGEALAETMAQIARDWRPYRVMIADNRECNRQFPDIVASVIVERIENLEVPLTRDGRYLTLDAAMAISERLAAVGRERGLADDAFGPDEELHAECLRRLFLDKDAEKNSASPPPLSPTPPASSGGAESTDGTSKVSANSTKTPARSSGNASSK